MANKPVVLTGSGALSEANFGHGSGLDADMLDGNEASAFAMAGHSHQNRIVGEMVLWPTNTPPSLWVLCNGQALSRSVYAQLWAVIGITYGSGDGSTTFNVPDLRGRFPLGKDNMGGTSANRVTAAQADTLGLSSGAETHTLTTTEMPSHTHPITYTNNLQSGGGGSNMGGSGLTDNTEATGGGSPHNNMPPYLTLNYIIYTG